MQKPRDAYRRPGFKFQMEVFRVEDDLDGRTEVVVSEGGDAASRRFENREGFCNDKGGLEGNSEIVATDAVEGDVASNEMLVGKKRCVDGDCSSDDDEKVCDNLDVKDTKSDQSKDDLNKKDRQCVDDNCLSDEDENICDGKRPDKEGIEKEDSIAMSNVSTYENGDSNNNLVDHETDEEKLRIAANPTVSEAISIAEAQPKLESKIESVTLVGGKVYSSGMEGSSEKSDTNEESKRKPKHRSAGRINKPKTRKQIQFSERVATSDSASEEDKERAEKFRRNITLLEDDEIKRDFLKDVREKVIKELPDKDGSISSSVENIPESDRSVKQDLGSQSSPKVTQAKVSSAGLNKSDVSHKKSGGKTYESKTTEFKSKPILSRSQKPENKNRVKIKEAKPLRQPSYKIAVNSQDVPSLTPKDNIPKITLTPPIVSGSKKNQKESNEVKTIPKKIPFVRKISYEMAVRGGKISASPPQKSEKDKDSVKISDYLFSKTIRDSIRKFLLPSAKAKKTDEKDTNKYKAEELSVTSPVPFRFFNFNKSLGELFNLIKRKWLPEHSPAASQTESEMSVPWDNRSQTLSDAQSSHSNNSTPIIELMHIIDQNTTNNNISMWMASVDDIIGTPDKRTAKNTATQTDKPKVPEVKRPTTKAQKLSTPEKDVEEILSPDKKLYKLLEDLWSKECKSESAESNFKRFYSECIKYYDYWPYCKVCDTLCFTKWLVEMFHTPTSDHPVQGMFFQCKQNEKFDTTVQKISNTVKILDILGSNRSKLLPYDDMMRKMLSNERPALNELIVDIKKHSLAKKPSNQAKRFVIDDEVILIENDLSVCKDCNIVSVPILWARQIIARISGEHIYANVPPFSENLSVIRRILDKENDKLIQKMITVNEDISPRVDPEMKRLKKKRGFTRKRGSGRNIRKFIRDAFEVIPELDEVKEDEKIAYPQNVLGKHKETNISEKITGSANKSKLKKTRKESIFHKSEHLPSEDIDNEETDGDSSFTNENVLSQNDSKHEDCSETCSVNSSENRPRYKLKPWWKIWKSKIGRKKKQKARLLNDPLSMNLIQHDDGRLEVMYGLAGEYPFTVGGYSFEEGRYLALEELFMKKYFCYEPPRDYFFSYQGKNSNLTLIKLIKRSNFFPSTGKKCEYFPPIYEFEPTDRLGGCPKKNNRKARLVQQCKTLFSQDQGTSEKEQSLMEKVLGKKKKMTGMRVPLRPCPPTPTFAEPELPPKIGPKPKLQLFETKKHIGVASQEESTPDAMLASLPPQIQRLPPGTYLYPCTSSTLQKYIFFHIRISEDHMFNITMHSVLDEPVLGIIIEYFFLGTHAESNKDPSSIVQVYKTDQGYGAHKLRMVRSAPPSLNSSTLDLDNENILDVIDENNTMPLKDIHLRINPPNTTHSMKTEVSKIDSFPEPCFPYIDSDIKPQSPVQPSLDHSNEMAEKSFEHAKDKKPEQNKTDELEVHTTDYSDVDERNLHLRPPESVAKALQENVQIDEKYEIRPPLETGQSTFLMHRDTITSQLSVNTDSSKTSPLPIYANMAALKETHRLIETYKYPWETPRRVVPGIPVQDKVTAQRRKSTGDTPYHGSLSYAAQTITDKPCRSENDFKDNLQLKQVSSEHQLYPSGRPIRRMSAQRSFEHSRSQLSTETHSLSIYSSTPPQTLDGPLQIQTDKFAFPSQRNEVSLRRSLSPSRYTIAGTMISPSGLTFTAQPSRHSIDTAPMNMEDQFKALSISPIETSRQPVYSSSKSLYQPSISDFLLPRRTSTVTSKQDIGTIFEEEYCQLESTQNTTEICQSYLGTEHDTESISDTAYHRISPRYSLTEVNCPETYAGFYRRSIGTSTAEIMSEETPSGLLPSTSKPHVGTTAEIHSQPSPSYLMNEENQARLYSDPYRRRLATFPDRILLRPGSKIVAKTERDIPTVSSGITSDRELHRTSSSSYASADYYPKTYPCTPRHSLSKTKQKRPRSIDETQKTKVAFPGKYISRSSEDVAARMVHHYITNTTAPIKRRSRKEMMTDRETAERATYEFLHEDTDTESGFSKSNAKDKKRKAKKRNGRYRSRSSEDVAERMAYHYIVREFDDENCYRIKSPISSYTTISSPKTSQSCPVHGIQSQSSPDVSEISQDTCSTPFTWCATHVQDCVESTDGNGSFNKKAKVGRTKTV